jgi:hypothetical protein
MGLRGGVALLLLVLYLPPVRELFPFSAPHLDDRATCLGAGLVSVPWFEGFKALRGRRDARPCSERPERAGGLQDVMGAIKKLLIVATPLG